MESDSLVSVEHRTNKIKNNNFEKSFNIDEALRLTGDGAYQLKIFVIFGLSLYTSTMELTSMAYALPIAKCDLKMTMKEQGLINSIGFIGIIISIYIWGFLSDTWGRKNVLLLSYGITFIFSFLSSLSPSISIMMIARFFVGVGISSIQPSITAYMAEFHCNENRGKWLSKINLFHSSSFVIQPLLSLAFVSMGFHVSLFNGLFVIKPWRLLLITISALPMICFFMMWKLPESPKFLLTQGKVKETVQILNDMFRVNNKNKNKDEYPVKDILVEVEPSNKITSSNTFCQYIRLLWQQTKPLFVAPYLLNMVIFCGVIFSIYTGGVGLFLWYPQLISMYQQNMDSPVTICEAFAMKNSNVNSSNSTLIDNLTQLANTTTTISIQLSTPVVETAVNSFTFQVTIVMAVLELCVHGVISYLIDKCGPKYVLSTGFLVSSAAIFALFWTRNFYLNIFLMKLMGIATACCTILYTISSDLFPTQYKGLAISIIRLIGRIGSMVGSRFVGPILVTNCSAALNIFAGLILCSAVAAIFILARLENYYKKMINKVII